MPSTVEAMLLFGSRSRGDADKGSDTDLAVFAEAESVDSLVGVKRSLCDDPGQITTNYSVYSLATAELMAAEGSLFLWHLKLEGKILFQRSNWVNGLLARLAPYCYAKAARDIKTFEYVLGDIGESLRMTESTILFETATLFAVLRSLGMIVTGLSGRPCFGRLEPIFRVRQQMGPRFTLSDEEIDILLAAKLMYSRKKPARSLPLTPAWCLAVKEKISDVASYARGLGYETSSC
jgi:hypothetical protein